MYKLTQKEIDAAFSIQADRKNYYDFVAGIDLVQDRLIPLLERKDNKINLLSEYAAEQQELATEAIAVAMQKDSLLRECRDFISLIAGDPDFQNERKELLTKLKDI